MDGSRRDVVGGGMSLLARVQPVNGLLGFADSLGDDEIRQLWRREHPLVLLHRTPPDDLPIPCVTVENKAGSRQLVDHLIEVHRASVGSQPPSHDVCPAACCANLRGPRPALCGQD